MRKIKHLFTALLLLCSVAVNAHDFEVDGIYYNITSETNKTVEVTYEGTYCDYSNEYTGGVVIPNSVTYNGNTYSVTSIGESALYYCPGLTSITIPNSVTSIGISAFYACLCLTSIEIPNSVTSIGESAFNRCSSLTSITIPNSVTSIGDRAFYDCSGLTSITIGNSVTTIGNGAFSYCNDLKTVINFSNLALEMGTTGNGDVAFYANKVINAPNGSIEGDFVFKVVDGVNILSGYIGNAVDLVLPDNCKGENYVIGENAFEGCSNLVSVKIPTNVTSIGEYAFRDCTGLTSITIGNSVTTIEKEAFDGCSGLTSIEIPNSVTSIGNYAFEGCSGLASIEIPNSVTSIGNGAFSCCSGLTSITISNSIPSIGNYMFYNCSGLTSVIIPDNVANVGNNAFDGCSNLETLYISSTIESIEEKAFANCNKINEIKAASANPIEENANIFTDNVYDNAVLYVPNNSKSLYKKIEPWNKFDIHEMDYTGIEEVKGEDENVEVVYDLQGREVETQTKGIYIINGKKKLVK